jgi:putative membrane protein (TIGR04086 family)
MNTRPASPKVNTRLLSTIFFCFSILFAGLYLANVIRMSILRQTGAIPMPEEMAFFSKSTNDVFIDITIITISTVSMLSAGYVAAARMKQNGWVVGWVTGAAWSLSYAGILVLYLLNGISVANQLASPEFIQKNFTYDGLNAYIATIPSDFIKAVLLCGIGGTIHDFVTRMIQSRNADKPEEFRPANYEDIFKNSY